MGEPAPLIVTALFGASDFAFLDDLRRHHFPPERNLVPAHLTMFHHLPPSLEGELGQRLHGETHGVAPPDARITAIARLERGIAFGIRSVALEEIRERLAEAFAPMLMPVDAAPWRPHVTIQNKAEPAAAAALHAALERSFRPRPLAIAGLASWRYRGGPWEPLSRHMFNQSARSLRN